MPKKPGTKITVKDQTMLYPTSAYDIFMTNQPAGSVVQTYTQPATYASVVSREATVSVIRGGWKVLMLTSRRILLQRPRLQMPICRSS
jgi:hypothetical protein